MKNQFGFIERADVVKEIFFHYSEYDGNIDDLELGGDVSFKVTYRNVGFRTNFERFVLMGCICFKASEMHLSRKLFRNAQRSSTSVTISFDQQQGKEVATEISKLPAGTVIFEDVALEKRRGKIQKPLPHSRRQSEPLSGRIVYETVNG